MAWVIRDGSGRIAQAFAGPQTDPQFAAAVEIADDAAELLAFRAARAVVVAQPSPRQWLERLPADKQAAIAAGALGNPAILLWVLKASGVATIDVTLQETIDGVAALVAAGVLTAADQAVLLAP